MSSGNTEQERRSAEESARKEAGRNSLNSQISSCENKIQILRDEIADLKSRLDKLENGKRKAEQKKDFFLSGIDREKKTLDRAEKMTNVKTAAAHSAVMSGVLRGSGYTTAENSFNQIIREAGSAIKKIEEEIQERYNRISKLQSDIASLRQEIRNL